jgi:uncharacterized protein involved in cysteine biosynthesis
MRFRLRTLLIGLAVLPPILATAWVAVIGVAELRPDIEVWADALWMLAGLVLAIALAIGMGFAVARVGNAVIGLWDDR